MITIDSDFLPIVYIRMEGHLSLEETREYLRQEEELLKRAELENLKLIFLADYEKGAKHQEAGRKLIAESARRNKERYRHFAPVFVMVVPSLVLQLFYAAIFLLIPTSGRKLLISPDVFDALDKVEVECQRLGVDMPSNMVPFLEKYFPQAKLLTRLQASSTDGGSTAIR